MNCQTTLASLLHDLFGKPPACIDRSLAPMGKIPCCGRSRRTSRARSCFTLCEEQVPHVDNVIIRSQPAYHTYKRSHRRAARIASSPNAGQVVNAPLPIATVTSERTATVSHEHASSFKKRTKSAQSVRSRLRTTHASSMARTATAPGRACRCARARAYAILAHIYYIYI